ncbi:MAG TPA: response regulator [Terriglobales bacterium]|nr:response regulator [Terriglobales bacterium]
MSRQTVILCIDDNPRALDIRQLLLQAKGFVVRTAADGPSGLEITKNEHIDAVILDYKMPGMDGEEVAKRLRARYPDIPIVLLSGFRGLIPESLLAIVDGFVEKGRPASLLISEVERLVGANGNHRTEEQRRA